MSVRDRFFDSVEPIYFFVVCRGEQLLFLKGKTMLKTYMRLSNSSFLGNRASFFQVVFLIVMTAVSLLGCEKSEPIEPNKLHAFVFTDHVDKPMFVIPEKYQPDRLGDVVNFRFDYKTKSPLASRSKGLDGNEVSVRIFYNQHGNSLRSERIVNEIKSKYRLDIPKDGVYEDEYGVVIYLYVINGDFLVVKDVAPGLRAYRAYRRLMDRIEIDYSITKDVSPDAFLEVDKSVMEMIDSFLKK